MTRNKKNKNKNKAPNKSTSEASLGSISEQNRHEQHPEDVGKQDKEICSVDFGDGSTILSEANSDPITEQNQLPPDLNFQNPVISDLNTDLDKHKVNEQQVDLNEKLKALQIEIDSCIQREAIIEKRIEHLLNENDSYLQEKASHDRKLEELKCEINSCILEEISLKERIKILEDDKDTWVTTYVIELEQSKDNLIQENKQLMKCVSSLEIRVQQLEEASVLASSATKITEVSNPPTELEDCNIIHENTLSSEIQTVSEPSGNPITTKHLSESHSGYAALSSTENSMEINTCANHVSESSSGQTAAIDGGSVEGNTNLEMLQLPLDEIKIEEIGLLGKAETDVELGVPLIEAPLIGAPFRMFSFVAKYVSGADLMSGKSPTSGG